MIAESIFCYRKEMSIVSYKQLNEIKKLKGYDSLAENGTFSGSDVVAYIIFPGMAAMRLGQVTTLTYSTYRETVPVRTLSRINVKGFSKGQRTIAGTMIFTVFDKHIVNQIKANVDYIKGIKKLKPCELPPFDIMLSFGNEYGASAKLFIYGVEVVDEGKIFSVEDMFTENTWSYMARDIDLMDDVDAEQNAPSITLGENSGSGSFNIDDLVGGQDYTKMQEELDKMKNDKQNAIDAAREAAKDYITNNDDIEFEEQVIVKPIVPGGDDVADLPDYADPDEDIEKCFDRTFRVCTSPGDIKFDEAKGERLFRVDVDLGGWANGCTMQNVMSGKKLKVRYRCIHKDSKGKEYTDELVRTFTFPKDSISMGSKISNVIYDRARIYIVIGGYTKHTVKPDVAFQLGEEKITYTYKNTVGFITVTTTNEYKATNMNWVSVKGDGEATHKNPLIFKYAKVGSKDDKQAEKDKGVTAHISVSTLRPKLTTIPNRGYKANQQPVWLLGGDLPNVVPPYRALRDTKAGSAGVVDNGWIHGSVPNLAFSHPYKDQFGIKDPNMLWTGFKIDVTLKEDGKVITKKNRLDDFELVCDYRITAKIKTKSQSVSSEYSIEGEKERQRYSWYYSDQNIKNWLEKPRKWTMKYYSKTDMWYNDVELKLFEAISHVYQSVHLNTDPLGKEMKYYMHDPYEMLDPKKCDCRFKFDDITFELYNFRIVGKSGVQISKTTRNICGSTAEGASVRFPIVTLDKAMLAELNKM